MISVEVLSARLGAFQLRDVTFTVPKGAYGIVIGAAGAGKTTLLEAIAGVVPATSGTIRLGGENITGLPPERRRLSLVYQHAYLFPHLTVRDNVAYGSADGAAANEMLDRSGLAAVASREVRSLS